VFSRTVTDERVTSELSCPAGYSSYTGSRALRRLTLAGLPAELRRPILARRDRIEACFAATTTTVGIDLQLAMQPSGTLAVSDSSVAELSCVRDALADLRAPRTTTSRLARVHLDYTVEDPHVYATPLDCSF
jgi:hypothetical protein